MLVGILASVKEKDGCIKKLLIGSLIDVPILASLGFLGFIYSKFSSVASRIPGATATVKLQNRVFPYMCGRRVLMHCYNWGPRLSELTGVEGNVYTGYLSALKPWGNFVYVDVSLFASEAEAQAAKEKIHS